MDVDGIMLSDISQPGTSTVWFHFYMGSKVKQNKTKTDLQKQRPKGWLREGTRGKSECTHFWGGPHSCSGYCVMGSSNFTTSERSAQVRNSNGSSTTSMRIHGETWVVSTWHPQATILK